MNSYAHIYNILIVCPSNLTNQLSEIFISSTEGYLIKNSFAYEYLSFSACTADETQNLSSNQINPYGTKQFQSPSLERYKHPFWIQTRIQIFHHAWFFGYAYEILGIQYHILMIVLVASLEIKCLCLNMNIFLRTYDCQRSCCPRA